MKKFFILITSLLLLVGCTGEKPLQRYQDTFFGTFDTVITVIGYAEDEAQFNEYMDFIEGEFQRLHKEFDYYNTYEGVNNIYTINENAGVAPVKVSDDLFHLIQDTLTRTETIANKTDITYGRLFELWHDYREQGEALKEANQSGTIPTEAEITEAQKHHGLEHVILDEAKKTVYIDDANIRIDVGAVGKGYATELVAKAVEEKGLTSAIINSGGNIRTIGKPADGRENWGIGIQNPDFILGLSQEENAEVLYVNKKSVVTSGDYQRFYEVDGKLYHHLINPETGYPETMYRSVSVLTEDSGLADFLSTTLFLLPLEEGKALAEEQGVDVLWILQDGTKEFTEGMKAVAHSHGATQ